MVIDEKLGRLNAILCSLQKVVVAFSGGVDSTFLAVAAQRALGDQVALITAFSTASSQQEQSDVASLASELGIRHVWLPGGEMDNPLFIANTADRCYYCKKDRFSGLLDWAKVNDFCWVVEGTNADDLTDFRPGMRAVAELGSVRSPLMEAGFTKNEIRALSREWGLSTWNKPSAACLVSRLAYGIEITAARLQQVDQAEQLIRQFCQGQVRVRHHGDLARIEVAPECLPAIAAGGQRLTLPRRLKPLALLS